MFSSSLLVHSLILMTFVNPELCSRCGVGARQCSEPPVGRAGEGSSWHLSLRPAVGRVCMCRYMCAVRELVCVSVVERAPSTEKGVTSDL